MPLTDLDYDATFAKMRSEYEELVERLWKEEMAKDSVFSRYEERFVSAGEQKRSIDEKGSLLEQTESALEHPELRMYNALLVHLGFWHALDNWHEMRDIFGEERMREIEKMVVETAHRVSISPKFHAPGDCHPFFTLLEYYSEGAISDITDDRLLSEIVTRGFWDIVYYEYKAGYYVKTMNDLSPLFGKYLDLSRINEFYKGKIDREWVTEGYMRAFDKAEATLKEEDAAKLAAPIIGHLVWDETDRNAEPWAHYYNEDQYKRTIDFRGRQLAKTRYGPYIHYPDTQEMLRETAATQLKLALDDNVEVPYTVGIRELLEFIDWNSDAEKREFLNSHIGEPGSQRDAELLVGGDFPAELLSGERLAKIEKLLKDSDVVGVDLKALHRTADNNTRGKTRS